MKYMRRGFTLIELLSVITILSILALIVTPIATGIIKDSKLATAERSMDGYVDAVESASLSYLAQTGQVATGVDDLTLEGKNIEDVEDVSILFTSTGFVRAAVATIGDFTCSYIEGKTSICSRN